MFEMCDACLCRRDAEFNQRKAAQFWTRVRVGHKKSCWMPRNTKSKDRVAVVEILQGGKTRRRQAHRFAYEVTFGPVTDDFYVMHSCGCATCLNPHHLYLEKRSVVRSRIAREQSKKKEPSDAYLTDQAV